MNFLKVYDKTGSSVYINLDSIVKVKVAQSRIEFINETYIVIQSSSLKELIERIV